MVNVFFEIAFTTKRILENKLPKENEIVLPKTSYNILQLFETQNNLTVNDAVKILNLNINTAKKAIKTLLDKGFITKYGTTKGVWYSKKENI